MLKGLFFKIKGVYHLEFNRFLSTKDFGSNPFFKLQWFSKLYTPPQIFEIRCQICEFYLAFKFN